MLGRTQRRLIGILLFVLLMSACAFLGPATSIGPSPDALHTQAAQTVFAQLTQVAVNFTPIPIDFSPTQPVVMPSETQRPTDTPPPTNTPLPPTNTSMPPTNTPVPPTATPTPIPCDWAKFVEDVTVKDGTEFAPYSVFTKTWRLMNIGTCTWSRDYSLIFVSGDRMGGPQSIQLPGNVRPGETVDLSVELIAPGPTGKYRGNWQLRSASGVLFGIGPRADRVFWVDVKVGQSNKYAYDFAANYCSARWLTDAGRLPCPKEKRTDQGYVVLVDKPEIEIGRLENEPALVTVPEYVTAGWIKGEYPEFKVEGGNRFRAIVGCMDEAMKCDVIFQVNYRVEGGSQETMFEKRELYDGSYTDIDIDLSPWIDKKIQFILTVLSNSSPEDDLAFWLLPRITK